jgi:hypothetical protein
MQGHDSRAAGVLPTKPCVKQMSNGEARDQLLTRWSGTIGSLAIFPSHKIKSPNKTIPPRSGPRTLAEIHGETAPPRSRLSSTMTAAPMIAMHPVQSNSPSLDSDCKDSASSTKTRSRKEPKQIGRLIQNNHRQDRYCDKTPPSRGPIPADKAHTSPVVLRKNPRDLKVLSK